MTERINNGGFETGDFTGWTTSGSPSVISSDAHSGTYCAYFNSLGEGIEQTLSVSQQVNGVTKFSFWQKGNSPCPTWGKVKVTITYTDSSTTLITGLFANSSAWIEQNLIGYLESGKTISKIKIELTTNGSDTKIDDISLEGTNTGHIILNNGLTTFEFEALTWEEKQECAPAYRPIPKRTAGGFVDTGTYVLKNRHITLETRLTDNELSTLINTFVLGGTTFSLIAKTGSGNYPRWTYTVWIEKMPITWLYSVRDGELREWYVEIDFVCSTFTYETS